jgi:7-cyano-7-deazaguanine synthase
MLPSSRAIVLLSGGLDSAVTAAAAQRDGFEVHALSVRYGQRHAVELQAAARVAASLGIRNHVVVEFDPRAFVGSALTSDAAVPRDTPLNRIGERVPTTYVPARNTIFLSLALGRAEAIGAHDIFIGANAVDYSGYPDCRPEYLDAFQRLANLATRAATEEGVRFRIHAPLLRLRKSEIVRLGLELGVELGLTSTCYDPSSDGAACGRCEACLLRLQGFEAAGLPDPARYQAAHA